MAVVYVSVAIDGFKVSSADRVAIFGFNGYGLDPVKGVLEREDRRVSSGGFCESENELMRE